MARSLVLLIWSVTSPIKPVVIALRWVSIVLIFESVIIVVILPLVAEMLVTWVLTAWILTARLVIPWVLATA